MTRRISRAKQQIKDSGSSFALPPGPERAERLGAVLHVLYLIFNEGYASTSGPRLHRAELAAEAIRLARLVHRLLPDDGEVAGLLALMLLTDARRPARTGPDGALIPMAEQDRSRWNADHIAEGVALITAALPRGATGPYQLQAAIAAVHDEAPSAEATDWPQIVALYEVLLRLSDNPVVALNHAVAVAMVRGAPAGLDLLDELGRGRADRRGPPAARGPRAPAGDGRRPRRRRARPTSARRSGTLEPAAAALPARPSSSAVSASTSSALIRAPAISPAAAEAITWAIGSVDVAGHPDAGDGGRAGRVGRDAGADPAARARPARSPRLSSTVGPGGEARRDHQGAAGDQRAVGQAHVGVALHAPPPRRRRSGPRGRRAAPAPPGRRPVRCGRRRSRRPSTVSTSGPGAPPSARWPARRPAGRAPPSRGSTGSAARCGPTARPARARPGSSSTSPVVTSSRRASTSSPSAERDPEAVAVRLRRPVTVPVTTSPP